MEGIDFRAIDWSTVAQEEHPGEGGTAIWQTLQLPGIRLRLVTYSEGYRADHWCRKGHIVHCLEGAFISRMEDGSSFELTKDMTYIVSDDLSAHRSVSEAGARLLIIDGDFLKAVKEA
jgi:hypothetical protein